jgi:UDP-N-acetyl-D-glucosamine/UDP-N-acetyl-D-galactosamine dehydrogenase
LDLVLTPLQFASPPVIGVLGLGYVGLPLTLALAKHFAVLGFDINQARVRELQQGLDSSGEAELDELHATSAILSADPATLRRCSIFIVAVPTPVSDDKQPDLSPLRSVSEMLGLILKRGDIVVYESTVYPGCTREVCVPILEARSGLKLDQDFAVGYSPERINPGDKQRRLPDITKVVSASSAQARDLLVEMYGRVVPAGIHAASSIEVAEAAKALENTQRDVNIALMNEFSQMARRLGIDAEEVLAAARTKWNFLPFKPGLVGGHCVGVDPYYLVYKAMQVGYFPELISASRRINEGMPAFLAAELVKLLLKSGRHPSQAKVLLLGATFKPDCPDLRNTKVVELVRELTAFGLQVSVFDPWIHSLEEAHAEGLPVIEKADASADVLVLSVAHQRFKDLGAKGVRSLGAPGALLLDLQNAFARNDVDGFI